VRGKVQGFDALEVFEWSGVGAISRRFSPKQQSKRFGVDYASWEAPGAVSAWLAAALVGDRDWGAASPPPAKCTRMDVAFDWGVNEDFAPVDLREMLRGEVELVRGNEFLHAGSERFGSVYVNKNTSPRQLCIYRRDWLSTKQRGAATNGVHVLRQEMRLREGRAQQAWREFCRSEESGLAFAAVQLREITGQEVPDFDGRDAPSVEPKPRRFITGAAWLLKQHAGTLHHLLERVGSEGFASLVEFAYRRSSAQAQARSRKCAGFIKDRSAAQLCEAIESQLLFT